MRITGRALHVLGCCLLLGTLACESAWSQVDVLTHRYDNARTGANLAESQLNTSNVNPGQFGKLFSYTVDADVYTQPLVIRGVSIVGKGMHNVVYVATNNNSVYAFDADNNQGPNDVPLWQVNFNGPGVTPIPASDVSTRNSIRTPGPIGIMGTPVINQATGTMYLVARTKETTGSSTSYVQRLHALDITTGAELAGSPTEVQASYPGTGDHSSNGNVVFDPGAYKERAALLLLNGNVYLGWSSHCDYRPYTGWVMAYSESTLRQTQLLNLTPNGIEGSIWMSGSGLAADGDGNIYLSDANGTFDTSFDAHGFPVNSDYGNAILKLSTSGKLAVADYFESYNTRSESASDLDLGSGGVVLLPDQKDAQGVVRHLIVGGGKDGNIYIADRDNLGKFQANDSDNSYIHQFIHGALAGSVYSTPAFFNGVLYYAGAGDALKAFPMTDAQLATTPSSQTATSFVFPGTTPSISANGTQNGIVWALESNPTRAAVLHAYDASSLARELYNSQQAPNGRDSFGKGNKFIAPLVVNGKVYVGTPTGVAVFGLLPQ